MTTTGVLSESAGTSPAAGASVRLARRVAADFGCSRTQAEHYVLGGWVLLDGVAVEEPGVRVLPQQRVELLPGAVPTAPQPVTLLLHQPAAASADLAALQALLQNATRAANDTTPMRFLKRHLQHLTLLAPLQPQASGLVVLSQDWRIVRKLSTDLSRVEQEYIVQVNHSLPAAELALLNHGLDWHGQPLAPARVSWQNETHLRFALKGPQPGQIAAMCAQVGLQPLALKRIRIGRVPLAALPSGEWRYLAADQRF